MFTSSPIKQLTPIERYALHYLEYLHISDDESALKVKSVTVLVELYMFRPTFRFDQWR